MESEESFFFLRNVDLKWSRKCANVGQCGQVTSCTSLSLFLSFFLSLSLSLSLSLFLLLSYSLFPTCKNPNTKLHACILSILFSLPKYVFTQNCRGKSKQPCSLCWPWIASCVADGRWVSWSCRGESLMRMIFRAKIILLRMETFDRDVDIEDIFPLILLHARTHIYVYIYIYIHTHIHTHTLNLFLFLSLSLSHTHRI